MSGKELHLQKILSPDGRALVVALDHGSDVGPVEGLEDPLPVLRQVVAGGCDAVMTTPGVVQRHARSFDDTGVIMRVDGGSTRLGVAGGDFGRLFDPKDALLLGADGVLSMGFVGEGEHAVLTYLAGVSSECMHWALPLVAQMVPRGQAGQQNPTVDNIRLAARVGAEYGADIVATMYTGSADSFRQVTSACFVPLLAIGGPRGQGDRALLQYVSDVMSAGAAGILMGKGIWQHPHPELITQAMASIIHEQAGVEEALRVMDRHNQESR